LLKGSKVVLESSFLVKPANWFPPPPIPPVFEAVLNKLGVVPELPAGLVVVVVVDVWLNKLLVCLGSSVLG